MNNLNTAVVTELKAMKNLGMRVPASVIEKVSNGKDLSQYDNMPVSQLAELLIDLESLDLDLF